MNIRGFKTALHMSVAFIVALTSLTFVAAPAESAQLANPAPVCVSGVCSVSFPYGGSYIYTPPRGASITVVAAGGSAGGGGSDTYGGGAGLRGSKVEYNFVGDGTPLTIYPGGQGYWGGSNMCGGGGGAGGTSFYPGGEYAGGKGSDAGDSCYSGAGGGGGAATVIKFGIESSPSIVAAGGGGGSGGNQFSSGIQGKPADSAFVNGTSTKGGNNEIMANIYPVNPQALSTDGSGAGGGGGGVLGGAAGLYVKSSETFGTSGYTGTSTGPNGSTITQNGSSTAGNGFVTITYANDRASIVGPAKVAAAPVTFTVTFPVAPTTTLTASHFAIDTTKTTATGCSAPSGLTGSGTTYTITVSGCSVGDLSIKLLAGSVTANSVLNLEAYSNVVNIDQTAPTFTITAPTTPSNDSPLVFEVNPNELLTNSSVTTTDFSVSGSGCSVASVTAPTSPAAGPFLVNVTGCATAQSVRLTLTSLSTSDSVGNVGPTTAVASSSVFTDYVKPTGTWVTPTDLRTNLTTLYFTFLLSENVDPSSVTASDFAQAGTATGCAFSPSTNGQTVTLAVSGCSAGTLIPQLKLNSLVDLAGNIGPTAAINGPTVTRDVSVPTATIVANPSTTPTSATSLNYTVTFNEAVTGLSVADFTNTGTATGCVFTVTPSSDGLTAGLSANFCTDGTVIPTLAAASVEDLAGNYAPATSVSATAIIIDHTAPTVTAFTTAVISPTNATSIAYSLTFSESVSGIQAADFTNGGTATGCIFTPSTSAGTTITLTVTGCSTSGTLKPILANGSIVDSASNVGPAAVTTGPQLTLDRVAPIVLAGEYPDDTVGVFAPLTYTFSFSEPINPASLTAADFSNIAAAPIATGCIFTPVVAADGLSVTVSVSGCSEGNVKLRLAANSLSDLAGNLAPAAALDSPITSLINTAPRVTFSTVPATPTNASTLAYVATFSEAVTGVSAAAFTVSGTATGCVLTSSVTNPASSVSSTNLAITGCSEGTVIVTAKPNYLTDGSSASRVGPESAVVATTVTIDRTAPTATFSSSTPIVSPTGVASQVFTLTFSEPINPATLAAGDFSNVGAASASTGCVFAPPLVAADGRTATVTVTGCTSGNFLPQLAASSFTDLAGNNSAATPVKLQEGGVDKTIVIDRTVPTATMVAVPTTTPAATEPTYTLTFSETVTGVSPADITNSGTATGCSFAVSGSGTTYTVTPTGCSTGTLILNFAANGVTDNVGATGPASVLVASSITLDKTGPSVNALTTSATAVAPGANISFSITFDQATSNIAAADFENSGTATGCTFTPAAATAANATTFTVACTGEGTVIPRIKPGSVTDALANTGPTAAYNFTGSVVVDGTAPTASITTTVPVKTNGASLTYTVNFSDSVTGIAAADFSNGAATGAATGCVFVPSATSGNSITVTVNSCSAGNFELKLANNGVTNLVSQTGPAAPVVSSATEIERSAPTASLIAPASPNNATTQVFTVRFNENVSGLTLDDFAITGVTGCVPTLSNLTETGATLTLASCSTGALRVALEKDSVIDPYGNLGPISEVVTEVGLDRTAPVITITSPASPTNAATLSYSIALSEPVSEGSLTASDFVVVGNGCQVGTLTEPTAPAYSPLILTVTGCADSSTLDVSLPARTVMDQASNIGPVTTVNAVDVVIDRVKPNATIYTSYPAKTNAAIISYTLVTSEPIDPTSVTAADFSNLGSGTRATGCVFSPYVVGQTITLTITGCSEGSVLPRLAINGLTDVTGNTGPAAVADGPTIIIDRTAPTETLSASGVTTPTSASSFTYNATFPEIVSGLTASDFTNAGTATGCVFTPVLANTGLTAVVTVTGCSEGTLVVSQGANTVTDTAGNNGPASALTMASVTIDRTAAAATITTAVSSPTNATSIVYAVSFTEAVTGIAAADFINAGTATGCVLTPSASSGTTINVTVTSCATSGTLKLQLKLGQVLDQALSASPAADTFGPELTLDRIVPTVTAGTMPAASVTDANLTYTYTVAEAIAPASLTATDFSNTGTATGCVIVPTLTNGTAISVSVTGCSDGTVNLRLAANSITDLAGNNGPAALIDSGVTTINTIPRAGFTTAPTARTNAATLNYTVTFTESVKGVTASDFVISGTATDCVLTLTSPANATTATTTAVFNVTGCAPGTVIVTMARDSVTDSGGVITGPAADLVTQTTIDRTAGTASIAPIGVIASPTGAASMSFKVTFTEPINATTLTASDFSNGAVATYNSVTGVTTPVSSCTFATPVVAADGLSATVEVTNCSSGWLNPKLGASSVTDQAGNLAPAATVKLPAPIEVDRSVPTATLVPVVSVSPTNAASINFTLTFNEIVTGVTASDFSNTGTATGCTFTVGGSGKDYTLTASNCSSGTLIANFAANGATDTLTVTGPAASVVAGSLTLDKIAPTATSIVSNRGISSAYVWNQTITVTLSEVIDAASLTAADFEIVGTSTGCTFGAPTYTAGTTSITLVVAANSCGDGNMSVRLKANSVTDLAGNVGPTANVDSAVIYVADSSAPTAAWTTVPQSPSSSDTINFTVTFSDYVGGIAAGDFSNAISSANGGATGCVYTPSAAAGVVFVVAVTGCSSGQLALKMNANAGATEYAVTGPVAAITASTVIVDKTLATATITSVYGNETDHPDFVVDFSEAITGLTLSDFTVLGDPKCVPSIVSQTGTRVEVSVDNCDAGSTIRLTLAAGSVTDTVGNASPLTIVSSQPVLVLLKEQDPLTVSTNLTAVQFGSNTAVRASVPTSGVGAGSGTGVVTFATSTPSLCSINATTGVITGVALGDCMVSASKAGDSQYQPVTSSEVKVRFTKAPQAALVISATPATQAYQPASQPQTATVTVTGGSGAGAVTAEIDASSSDVCSIEGLVVIFHIPGNCLVDVTKDGGANYDFATGSVTVTMTKTDQATLTASASVDSVAWNTTSPITVSVPLSGIGSGSGTGEVIFSSLTSSVCGVDPDSGLVTVADPAVVGDCQVVATKQGDEFFNLVTSNTVTIALTKANQAPLFGVADDPTGTVADTVNVSVSEEPNEAGSGSGIVTYSVTLATSAFCTVNEYSGVVVGKKPGTCSIILTKSGDDLYNQQISAPVDITIIKSPQEIVFVPIAQLINGGKALPAGAAGKPFTVAAASTALTIIPTFVSNTPTVCTVVGNKVTPKALGTCTITASAAGNESYLPATDVTKSIAIVEKPIPQTLVHTPTARINLALGDSPVTAMFTAIMPGTTVAANDFVTPVIAIDKASAKICNVLNGKLQGLAAGVCNYTISSPAVGAFLPVPATKFSSTFFAGDNETTQQYPTDVEAAPHAIVNSSQLLLLRGASSASQPVSYKTADPKICWADSAGFLHLEGAGSCVVTAVSGGGKYTLSESAPMTITVNKAAQVGTYVAPGEVIPGSSPQKRAPAATDSAEGFPLQYTLNSGQTPKFVSLDPDICMVEDDGTVTWVPDIKTEPSKNKCRVQVSADATSGYDALAPQVLTVTASANTIPYVPGAPIAEKPVYKSVPRTGGTVKSGPDSFAVNVKNDKIDVKPMSAGLYIGPITAVVSVPYKVQISGVWVDKVQTCTTKFGVQKKIAANKSPMAPKTFTNSITCALNKDAFAYFKSGASLDITAQVTRVRLYPTTLKPYDPKLKKPIVPKTVTWHLTVG